MARTRKQVRKGDRIYWAGKMFEGDDVTDLFVKYGQPL